jgi:hypothetical protein
MAAAFIETHRAPCRSRSTRDREISHSAFAVGRLKIRGFSLGTVVSTLLAGVVIGQFDIKVPSIVKTVFFDLFLFTTGYKVGPQFFRGLRRDAFSQMTLTLVLCVTCLATVFVASRLLGYDVGLAAFDAPGRCAMSWPCPSGQMWASNRSRCGCATAAR